MMRFFVLGVLLFSPEVLAEDFHEDWHLAEFKPQPPHPPPGDFSGWIELVEDEYPVQKKVSLHLQYTVGEEGFLPGDYVRVEEPIFHGIRWAKWGYLTGEFENCTPISPDHRSPSVGAYTADSSTGAPLTLKHSRDDPEIHEYGYLDVGLEQGELVPGDVIDIYMGVLEEDCGWQTSHRAFDNVPLRVFEFLDSATEGILIEPSPVFSFLAEAEVHHWEAYLPSDGVVGEAVELRVVPLDRHGNLALGYSPIVTERVFQTPGVHRVAMEIEGEGIRSNPILISETLPEFRVFWGDLHTHHGHSYEDDLGDWIDLNHEYARDIRGLDFGAETIKGMYLELDSDRLWERVEDSCETYSVDEEYIALRAFEWMGDTVEGHHNVYFDRCQAPLPTESLPGVDEGLWPYMETAMAEWDVRAVSIPHASAFTGHNWKVRDDVLRPVVEVYSAWGNSLDESLVGNVGTGLRHGQRLGFIGASDNHDGFIGNDMQGKNVLGGLGAIVATELSASALLDGLSNRSTYATTGDRMLLRVNVLDEGVVYRPGEEWRRSLDVDEPAVLTAEINGTDGIALVQLLQTRVGARGSSEVVAEWGLDGVCEDCSVSTDLVFAPASTEVFWLRVEQVDGEVAWSSPFWVASPKISTDEPEQSCSCSAPIQTRSSVWSFVILLSAALWRRQSSKK